MFADERDRVLAAGMDAFVRKPYRPHDIYDCLARHLGVAFVYEGEPSSSTSNASASLDADTLAMLPAALRDELHATLLSLDPARIDGVLGRVSALDPRLGAAMAAHARRFTYSPLLHALQRASDWVAAGRPV